MIQSTRVSIQLFIWSLIVGAAAASNFCTAAETTDTLETLGSSLDDLETAPLGSLIRAEGRLTGENSRLDPANDKECVAYYLEVTLVSESTDSDNNTEHHYYRVFKDVQGPSPLVVASGRVKVALPLRYWTRYHKTQTYETTNWPRWLDTRHQITSYTGSFDRYDIETVCLEAGARLFLAGAVADVTEAGTAEASSERLLEIRNPLITLRPTPGLGPVEVWPGTEQERIGNLVDYRRRKRIYGGLLTALCVTLTVIGVIVARAELA